MKVLFVASGNSKSNLSPIVKVQGDSLENQEIDLHYYTIKGKGLWGYLANVSKLKKYLKQHQFDVFHAHYSLSAIAASLAGAKPLVVSLMGSDVKAKKWFRFFIWVFYKFFWRITIVKSEDMKKSLGFQKLTVIPNGVNTAVFSPKNQVACQDQLNWNKSKAHFLFAANPDRSVKNFKLTKKAINKIRTQNIELHYLQNVPHEEIPIYLNAADVVILTSLWEGSPNVIKESMACNRPIVSTRVGDVEWLFGDLPGHFLTSFDVEDVADSLKKALAFSSKFHQTNGQNRIIELELDSVSVAKKIIEVYETVLRK